jgi:hypothetical protein
VPPALPAAADPREELVATTGAIAPATVRLRSEVGECHRLLAAPVARAPAHVWHCVYLI